MKKSFTGLEKAFFRRVNAVVEPVVRSSLAGKHIPSEAILLTPGFENLEELA